MKPDLQIISKDKLKNRITEIKGFLEDVVDLTGLFFDSGNEDEFRLEIDDAILSLESANEIILRDDEYYNACRQNTSRFS